MASHLPDDSSADGSPTKGGGGRGELDGMDSDSEGSMASCIIREGSACGPSGVQWRGLLDSEDQGGSPGLDNTCGTLMLL